MPRIKKTVKRPWIKERKPFERNNPNSEFYNSRKWRNARAKYLEKHPLCENCKKKGLYVSAYLVDHITAINKGGSKFNEKNFQALCEKCHNKKSGKEAHDDRNR